MTGPRQGKSGPGPVKEGEEFPDILRESEVTAGDRLDDRVEEAQGLGDAPTDPPEDDR